MKRDIYNVCLIGALAQISKAHLEAINVLPQFQLCAVCDVDKKRLMERYPDLPESAVYDDYEKAVKHSNCDIVIVATSNKLHEQVSTAALSEGKIVLCEKPMTHSLESAKVIYNSVEETDCLFVISYHFRFHSEVQEFLRLRKNFGRIVGFRFISSEDLETEKRWILDKNQGGPWLDWAPNALSVLRPILAERELFESYAVNDVRYTYWKEYEIELKADVDLTLDEIPGNISVDWLATKGTFTAKTILYTDDNKEITLDHGKGEILVNREVLWQGKDKRYIDVYEDFYNRISIGCSNIAVGMKDAEIIHAVKNWTKGAIERGKESAN
jgi:predicted dehydrogenase